MNKKEFLELDKILVNINFDNYFSDDYKFSCYEKKISKLVNIFHPWYNFNSKTICFEDARNTGLGAAELGIRLADVNLIDTDENRKKHIQEIQFMKLHPVPIATDVETGYSFFLDSNHTLSNIYRKYLKGEGDMVIPIVELEGKHLERVFSDFQILNKKQLLGQTVLNNQSNY